MLHNFIFITQRVVLQDGTATMPNIFSKRKYIKLTAGKKFITTSYLPNTLLAVHFFIDRDWVKYWGLFSVPRNNSNIKE